MCGCSEVGHTAVAERSTPQGISVYSFFLAVASIPIAPSFDAAGGITINMSPKIITDFD